MPNLDSGLELIEAHLILGADIKYLQNILYSITHSDLAEVEGLQKFTELLRKKVDFYESNYKILINHYQELRDLNPFLNEEGTGVPQNQLKEYLENREIFKDNCRTLQEIFLSTHQNFTRAIDVTSENFLKYHSNLIRNAITACHSYLNSYDHFAITQMKIGEPLPFYLIEENKKANLILSILTSIMEGTLQPRLAHLKEVHQVEKENEFYLANKMDEYERGLRLIRNQIINNLNLIYLNPPEVLQDEIRSIRVNFNTYKSNQPDFSKRTRLFDQCDFSSPNFFWTQSNKQYPNPNETVAKELHAIPAHSKNR